MADIQHLASLTEEDIKFRYITPAIEQAGWQKNQIRMEYFFTDGRHTVATSSIHGMANRCTKATLRTVAISSIPSMVSMCIAAARHTVVISSITWMVPSLYLF